MHGHLGWHNFRVQTPWPGGSRRQQHCCTAWTWLFGWADFLRHKVIVANGPLAQGAVWRMQYKEQHRHNGSRPHDTGAQLTPQSAALLHRLQVLVAFHLLSLTVPIARPPSPQHLCARSLVWPKCSARPVSWALRAKGTMQPDERDTRRQLVSCNILTPAHLRPSCLRGRLTVTNLTILAKEGGGQGYVKVGNRLMG